MPNPSRSARTRRIAAAVLALAVVPGLAGCFNGFEATTNTQATMNSGNGVQATAGAIRIDNATLVRGADPTTATLLMRITNTGDTADQLTGVTIAGAPATITGDVVEIPPGQGVSFGYESTTWVNTYELDAEESSWVDVVVSLRDAGEVPMQVLTVPPVGQYEGIAPNPPAPLL